MVITQAHVDFYRARKVPAAGLLARVKVPTSYAVRGGYRRPAAIDELINSQTVDARRGRTEPHNILMFIRGWRSRGEDLVGELWQLAYQPYQTDPKRRTAYARRWHARLVRQRARWQAEAAAEVAR